MRGFSLFEIVLVIALLGVLAIGVGLTVTSVGPANLNAAALQVQSDIDFARQNAMMTGQTSGVQFVAAGAYTVYQGSTATPLKGPLTNQNMVITLSSTYHGISINNNYTVQFNNLGAPTTGGGSGVTITNGTTSHTISVTANTGWVFIQ